MTEQTAKRPVKKSSKPMVIPEKKLTALEKIEGLENKLLDHEKNFLILADEIDNLKLMLTGLNRRLNAVISAGETEAGISHKSVKDIIVEENVKELSGKISFMVEQGAVEASKEGDVITRLSFIVGKEVDAEGNTINPRTQFSTQNLSPEIFSKLEGKKVGDALKFREEDPDFIITELYNITTDQTANK